MVKRRMNERMDGWMDVFPHQDLWQPRPCLVKHSRTLVNSPANTEQHLSPACIPTWAAERYICSQNESIVNFFERKVVSGCVLSEHKMSILWQLKFK